MAYVQLEQHLRLSMTCLHDDSTIPKKHVIILPGMSQHSVVVCCSTIHTVTLKHCRWQQQMPGLVLALRDYTFLLCICSTQLY